MAKKREDRIKEKKAKNPPECDLDSGFISPIQTIRDISPESVRSVLLHSRYVQIILSLTVIGALLRFYHLGYNSLWLDEAATHTFASLSLAGIWQLTTSEINPPLFHWIEHFMLFAGDNETILRFVPALAGVLTIPLIYIIGREFFDRNVGIIAASAVAFSPFLIFYSQEARAYSLMLFFVASAMIFYLRALREKDLKDWILFGILSALAFWTHFYSIVIIGALILYALGLQLLKARENMKNLRMIGFGIIVLIIGCLPLVISAIRLFISRSSAPPSFGIQGIDLIYATFLQMSGSEIGMYLFVLLFAVGITQAFITDRNKGIFLVSTTALVFIMSVILSYKIPMVPRYLIFFDLIFVLGIAFTYRTVYSLWNSRSVVYLFLVFFVVVGAPVLTGYYSGFSKDDWRGFSTTMAQTAKPGDLIVSVPNYVAQPFDYYYSNKTYKTYEFGANSAGELDRIYSQRDNRTVYFIVTGDIYSADPTGDSVTWLRGHTTAVGQNTGIALLVGK